MTIKPKAFVLVAVSLLLPMAAYGQRINVNRVEALDGVIKCLWALRVATRPNEIDEHDHGYSLEDLEQPNFRDVLPVHTRRASKHKN